MKPGTDLIYFISETHYFSKDYSVLNVTLVGALTKKNIHSFNDCSHQVLLTKPKCVIFNFRDVVPVIDPQVLPLLLELFRSIRTKPAFLRVSGLHPELKLLFQKHDMVNKDELVNNLADAFQSLLPAEASK